MEIKIGNHIYTYVKERENAPILVYRSDNTFLRIGPRELLEKEKIFHQKLFDLGFPVPQILEEGEKEGQYYFVESSVGSEHFGDIFKEDMQKDGVISDENFTRFLQIAKKFAEAQLKETSVINWQTFEGVLHANILFEELPVLREKSIFALKKARERTQELPAVLSHGDFNPYNIFEKGCIDLEHFSTAPAGYDVITNIFHFKMFPRGDAYEHPQKYRFSKEQIDKYFLEIDTIYQSKGLPAISRYKDDFSFCRSIWSTGRMARWPRLQKWRYRLYEELLNSYLQDKDMSSVKIAN